MPWQTEAGQTNHGQMFTTPDTFWVGVVFLKKDYFLMDVEAFYFKGLGFGYFK